MLTLASWALVVYGATLAVTGSSLAAPARAWLSARSKLAGKLVSCPMCFGFWVGLASFFLVPDIQPIKGPWYEAAPADAFAGMAVCWAFHVVLARLGAENL